MDADFTQQFDPIGTSYGMFGLRYDPKGGTSPSIQYHQGVIMDGETPYTIGQSEWNDTSIKGNTGNEIWLNIDYNSPQSSVVSNAKKKEGDLKLGSVIETGYIQQWHIGAVMLGGQGKKAFQLSLDKDAQGNKVGKVKKNGGMFIDMYSHSLDSQLAEEFSQPLLGDFVFGITLTYGLLSKDPATVAYEFRQGALATVKQIDIVPDFGVTGKTFIPIAHVVSDKVCALSTSSIHTIVGVRASQDPNDPNREIYGYVQVGLTNFDIDK